MSYFYQYYLPVLKNYSMFNGRTSRKEFWMFVLINIIVGIIIGIISAIVGDKRGVIGNLYNLAILLPSIAVGTRRLHDITKSGWWQLIALIPIIGWIWIIVLFATKGEPAENIYGKPLDETTPSLPTATL